MQEYAEKMGVEYAGIKINSAKTTLASGSESKVLSFSWRLITGDDEVVDYVVVLTLSSIIEPKHSPKYWTLVEGVMPDYKERQQKLKILLERLKSESWL